MRRQVPSIRNPRYPLAYRIYLSLDRPSQPWRASDLPFKLANEHLTGLMLNGFITSRGKKTGKGGTPANLWVFDPLVLENLIFISSRQKCTHLKKETSLFGEVWCRRLQHKMSLTGCRECLKFQVTHPDREYCPQSTLQRWGLSLPFL
jgi:hypothetical protein